MDPVFFAVYFLILFSITAAVLVLYLTPIDIRFVCEHYGGIISVSFGVAWGIFGVSATYEGDEPLMGVTLAGRTVFQTPIREAPFSRIIPSEPGEKPEEEPALSFTQVSRKLPATFPYLKKVVRTSVRACSLKKLDCDLVIGLSGAAETGRFFGAWSAVRPFLVFFPAARITILPVFDRPVLEGRCGLRVQVRRPADILVQVVRLAASSEVRGAMFSSQQKERGG